MIDSAALQPRPPSWADNLGHEPSAGNDRAWYVLWTRSNFEQVVFEYLSAKGYETFLPKLDQWSRKRGRRVLARIPMFPGYLFLRHAFDKSSYIDVAKARGLVRILGSRWDQLATVPDEEIDAIQKAVRSSLPAIPYPYLKTGQPARITCGPLTGVEGILAHADNDTGLFVLSIKLLQRSIAVEVDCADVVPA